MSDLDDNSTQSDAKAQRKLLKDLEKLQSSPPKSKNNALQLDKVPPKSYGIKLLGKFLDAVFHAGLLDDEHILTWEVAPYKHPVYPVAEPVLLEKLSKSKTPKALYYGTATCTPHPEDGKLYNRKALFSSLRVVVLDDIGTKVKVEDLPAKLETSYKLETSEGNYQYGLILDEPIEDLAAATALVHLIYESGYSDEGGKMANKLVRLPEGVNGKKGKAGFVTRLAELNKKTFTPQQVLDMVDVDVMWEEVLADAEEVTKRRAGRSVGSSPWATTQPQAMALNGIIDPVLEWLYETDQIIVDNGGDFVDIICPWGHEHSDGNVIAGYAPIGRGEELTKRGFHCFHQSCSDNQTPDFLKYVAINAGIEVGIDDPAAALTAQYVFDKVQNAVWDVKGEDRHMALSINGFTNLYPHKLPVYKLNGKCLSASAVGMWKISPTRVVVAGSTFDPSTTARIVQNKGENYVNLFSVPNWGKGAVEMSHVEKFKAFLEYLIPREEERDYFLMWLAAKCKDMSFRGAAMVMVAQNQGVGRSTLGDMIGTLMGVNNVSNVALTEMLGDNQFNEWQAKPFVVVEETLAADRKDFYSNYEKLKGFIDPRATSITINKKFGLKTEAVNYASYLFLTNHANALAMPDNDRRFMVIQNAYAPASPEYFKELNDWLFEKDKDGMPSWARNVYRWLQTVETDITFLTAPPPSTESKTAMAGAALSDVDYAVKELLKIWPDPYIASSDVLDVLTLPHLAGALRMEDLVNVKYIRTEVNRQSVSFDAAVVVKVGGRATRPRILHSWVTTAKGALSPTTNADKAKVVVTEAYNKRKNLIPELGDKLVEILQTAGRMQ